MKRIEDAVVAIPPKCIIPPPPTELSEEVITAARRLYAEGCSYHKIAKTLGLSFMKDVSRIKFDLSTFGTIGPTPGWLTDDIADEVRDLHTRGFKLSEIAEMLKVPLLEITRVHSKKRT